MKNNVNAWRPPIVFVAFGGGKTHWWTRFLKKGFYHCLLVAGNGEVWTIIDPVYSFTDLVFVNGNSVLKVLGEKGYRLVCVSPKMDYNGEGHIFRPFTCVEVVKHFLGISNPFIFTPYQLFKKINKAKGVGK